MISAQFKKEEIEAIKEFNESPANPEKLTEDQIEALSTGNKMTVGLVLRAKRMLAEIELQKKGESHTYLPKTLVNYLATRKEVEVLEDAVNMNNNALFIMFTALVTKGILSEQELFDTVAGFDSEKKGMN